MRLPIRNGAIAALWRNRIAGPHVAVFAGLALLGWVTRALVVAPAFHNATGFIPFDLQPHLNREMVIIQLGAIILGQFGAAYLWYALADTLIALLIAAFFIALWQWLFAKTPNWLFTFIGSGGIVLLPLAAAVLEIAEHAAIFRLLATFNGDESAALIDFTATLHNVKIAVVELRNGLTLVYLAIAGGLWVLRRRAGS